MPISQVSDLVAVTYNFVLSTGTAGVEQAECTVWYLSDTNPVSDDDWNGVLQQLANGSNGEWRANVATEHWENSVTLANVTARHESTAGLTLHEQVYIPSGGDIWAGTGTGGSLPWQTSLCLSLYAYPRGSFVADQRSKRGRIYLPPMGVSVLNDASDGLLADDFVGDRMGEIGQSWTNVMGFTYTDLPAYHPVLGVNSRRQVAFYPVVQLSVDTKLDTQRRRTRSLIPNIGTVPFPIA